MKTVGSILKEARIARGLTFGQVEAATKIREKFLQAIESDELGSLPNLTYAKGFVKNYSEYLGLASSTVLAFLRRQIKESTKPTIVPKGVAQPLNAPFLRLTPGRFLALILSLLVFVFLGYMGLQYRKLQEPPALTLESPQEHLVTREKKVSVVGKSDPDATVLVNGVSALVRSDGRFFDQWSLEPGINTLTVTTTSRFGKSTIVTRSVIYQTEETR